MRYLIRILIVLCVCPSFKTNAQCPDRGALLTRISELKSSDKEASEQLDELFPYVKKLESCPVKNDSSLVYLLQRLGALYYLYQDFNNAVAYTRRSVNELTAMSPSYTNTPLLVRMYNYLGIFYDSLHRVSDKMYAIDSCVQIALRTNAVDYEILYNLSQRVDYSFDVGDYERCLNDASVGETLTEKYIRGEDSISFISAFFSQRVNALIELRKLEQAEQEVTEKIAAFLHSNKRKICGPFYNQLAKVHILQEKYSTALTDLNSSLKCNQLTGFRLGCKQSLNNIGFLYFQHLQNPATALLYYRKALAYNNDNPLARSNDLSESSNILGNIANVYVRSSQFDSAFYYFRKAFVMTGNPDENSFLEIPADEFIKNPMIQYVSTLIRDKADAYLAAYHQKKESHTLEEAIRIYRVADQVLTRVKINQEELQSKLVWRKNARSLYEHAIAACLAGNKIDEAFYFFEKSRAVLMNDQLIVNGRTSKENLLKNAGINYQLNLLKKQLADPSLPVLNKTEIQKSIFSLTREKDHISSQERIMRKWSDERKMDTSRISIQEVRNKLLTDKRSLLEIFSGDSAVYVFLLTADQASLKKIDQAQFDTLTRSYLSLISDPAQLNARFDEFEKSASALYKLLFGGFKIAQGPVIVSPDGSYFPLEALITGADKKQRPVYFLEAHALSYTYSARFLMHDFQSSRNGPASGFLGVAPVRYPDHFNLSKLSGSDGSIRRLSSFFNHSLALIGNAATKNEFLKRYSSFSIVHLYTHASEKSSLGDPVIYFSDSALYLSDLVALQSPATRMIILNACETGKGKLYEGEGIFSFNRAFAEAGVPSATVNLWSVDDQSSYKLCELFYKFLTSGVPSDIALQKAKLEFIATGGKERSLPFYWAAPILSGQVTTFIMMPDITPDYFLFLSTLLLVVNSIVILGRNLRTTLRAMQAPYTNSNTV